MEIDYGSHHQVGSIAFNHMMDLLGGFQVRYWQVVAKGLAKTSAMTTTARAVGFKFIKEEGPKANNGNQFVEWTEHHVNEPSPIQGWDRGLVKESLRNYAAGKVLAKTITGFPLTLKDIVPWFFHDVLINFLRDFEGHSIMWLGRSGIGKTPAAKTVAHAVSLYMLERDSVEDEPGFRTTKHIDFFRSEPGSIYKPDIFDDGVLAKLSADEYKSFHDPSEDDALLWARWGGAYFPKGQLRMSVSNPFDSTAESDDDRNFVTHNAFVSMIGPNFSPTLQPEDVVAILKRTNIVLFTESWVYHRKAGMVRALVSLACFARKPRSFKSGY